MKYMHAKQIILTKLLFVFLSKFGICGIIFKCYVLGFFKLYQLFGDKHVLSAPNPNCLGFSDRT